ncbi:hypothetical protein L9F63_028392, partial [Diploptera punctata]
LLIRIIVNLFSKYKSFTTKRIQGISGSPECYAPRLLSPCVSFQLKTLSLSQLNELYLELEVLIREFSETLIAELALRDELEYEKELKNTFISLLLAVQNKRRQYHVERKRTGRSNTATRTPNGLDPKYLTTVIPYHLGSGPPDNQALQVLIKTWRSRFMSACLDGGCDALMLESNVYLQLPLVQVGRGFS